jgi:plastocyanin
MVRSSVSRLTALAAVAGLVGVAVAGYALASEFSVGLTSQGPQPNLLTAALGDTVTFVNRDSATHTVVDRQTGLQSPALGPGQAFAFVLTKSGRLTFQQDGPPRGNGTIVVQRSGTVTLKASRRTIPFGSGVALSGTTSLPGFPVKIEMRPKGDKQWSEVATATPATDGSFTSSLKPQLGAVYRANVFAGELLSPTLEVDVRPVLTVGSRKRTARGGSLLAFRAHVVPANAAGSAELMRFDSRRRAWKRVGVAPVSGGKVAFRWRVEYGRSVVRVSVTKRGLARGFSASSSPSVVVVGTGVPPRRGRHH